MEQPPEKSIYAIILDAGPIIKNEPSISTLLSKAEKLATTPEVLSEIRDTAALARVETTLRPFLELRRPNPSSISFVQDFARRTGDLMVLSRTDIQLIALAYELECERNDGDWRLRRTPGQKRTNGPRPPQKGEEKLLQSSPDGEEQQLVEEQLKEPNPADDLARKDDAAPSSPGTDRDSITVATAASDTNSQGEITKISEDIQQLSVLQDSGPTSNPSAGVNSTMLDPMLDESGSVDEGSSSSDSEGWITPSNIKRRQVKDSAVSISQKPEPATMQVAIITTDFAMQNVILQINLNLLSPSLQRVRHLKTFILRCHACFQTTKDMGKQFCPRCGQPTLTRVSCSTNANGEFKLHLKRNMQWNTRGDRYSIPKPVSGASNGRVKGGGKGGWGSNLVLAEDQKEYVRAVTQEKRQRQRDLMDEDYLPSILSGRRDERPGGRPKIGAGRGVNSRKR